MTDTVEHCKFGGQKRIQRARDPLAAPQVPMLTDSAPMMSGSTCRELAQAPDILAVLESRRA